jgi:hypothetical protein
MSHGMACFWQITGPVKWKELSLLCNIITPDDTLGSVNSHTCNYVTGRGVKEVEFIMPTWNLKKNQAPTALISVRGKH